MVPSDAQLSNLTVKGVLVAGTLVSPTLRVQHIITEPNGSTPNVETKMIDAEIVQTDELIVGRDSSACTINSSLTTPHTYSLPEVGTDAQFVMTQGDQTISGVKSFANDVRFLGIEGGFPSGLNFYENLATFTTFSSSAMTTPLVRAFTVSRIGILCMLRITGNFAVAPVGVDGPIVSLLGAIPERFRRTHIIICPCRVFCTGVMGVDASPGEIEISAAGQMIIRRYNETTNIYTDFDVTASQIGFGTIFVCWTV